MSFKKNILTLLFIFSCASIFAQQTFAPSHIFGALNTIQNSWDTGLLTYDDYSLCPRPFTFKINDVGSMTDCPNGWGYVYEGINNNYDLYTTTTSVFNDSLAFNNFETEVLYNNNLRSLLVVAERTDYDSSSVSRLNPYVWQDPISLQNFKFVQSGFVQTDDLWAELNNNFTLFNQTYKEVNSIFAQLPETVDSFLHSELAFYMIIVNYKKYGDMLYALDKTIELIENDQNMDNDIHYQFNFILTLGNQTMYGYRGRLNLYDNPVPGQAGVPFSFCYYTNSGAVNFTTPAQFNFISSTDINDYYTHYSNMMDPGELVVTHSSGNYERLTDFTVNFSNLSYSRAFYPGPNYVSFPVMFDGDTIASHFSANVVNNIVSIETEDGTVYTGRPMRSLPIDRYSGYIITFATFLGSTEYGYPTDQNHEYFLPSATRKFIPYTKNFQPLDPPFHIDALGPDLHSDFLYMSPSYGVHHSRQKPGSAITSYLYPPNSPNPSRAKYGSMYIIETYNDVSLIWDGNSSILRSKSYDYVDDVISVSQISNYPNPFNPETTIRFNMSKAGNANVAVYNLKGQLVKTVLSGNITAGNKEVVWNGTDAQNNNVSSGVYFLRVKTDNQTINKKMVLQK